MIEVRDLEFRYGRGDFSLAVPSLSVKSGERVALVGPSGCGKTSLVYLIAGILRPERGTIAVDGSPITGLGEAALRAYRITRIGFVFQQFELLDYLTVQDNILLPNLVNDALPGARTRRDEARALASSLGVGDKLGRRPAQLSQGEKQRVAICRALLNAPDIIIADEPTGNLDPDMSHRIMDLIHEQVTARGATLLMVTHDHTLLEPFDRVIDCRAFAAPAEVAA